MEKKCKFCGYEWDKKSLSDKYENEYRGKGHSFYWEEDVGESVKELKEIQQDWVIGGVKATDIIDKIFGEKLT